MLKKEMLLSVYALLQRKARITTLSRERTCSEKRD